MKSRIVYKLSCICGFTFIGQIRRKLLTRIKVHTTSKKSDFCKPLLQNPTHCVNFNTPTILGSENDTTRLLSLKSLFIQEQTPDLNNDSQSSPLMIFNTKSNSHCVSLKLHLNFLIFCCHVFIQT